MSLRIRFRGSVLAGQVFTFEDDVGRIVIGRDPERCQVVLPADLTAVGREHVALERVLARYRLVLNKANPVLVDGEVAHDGQELPSVAYVRLGADGPEFVAQTLGADSVPETEVHVTAAPDLHDVVTRQAKRSSVTRWVGALALGVVVALIVWAVAKTGRQVATVTEEQARVRGLLDERNVELARLAEQHRETTSDLRDRLEDVGTSLEEITPNVSSLREAVADLGPRMEGLEKQKGPRIKRHLQGALPSVYVVVMRDGRGVEHAVATAWVAGEGQLATNAHVAQLLKQARAADDGTVMFVRSPGAKPRDHAVTGVVIHPGFDIFMKLWMEYRPTGMSPEGRLHFLRPAGAACDVALLEVGNPEALAPVLEIAGRDGLLSLSAGDVVGLVGYPSEDLSLGGVNLMRPKPTTQIAHVTAVTNFFLAETDAAESQLVQNALPVTGGASGSPILDEEGRVVAVLSAGNIEVNPLGNRAPSAVLVNFAQRADLVLELLEGTADEAQVARTKRWEDGISTLMSLQSAARRGALGYLKRYLEVVKRDVGKTPALVAEIDGSLDQGLPGRRWQGMHDELYEIPETGVYVVFVYGIVGQNVDLAVLHETDDAQVFGQAKTPDWYAAVRVEADAGAKVRLRVTGPRDAEYRLLVHHAAP